ncbi:type IV secretory system conjugative DNA transfer family protein [Klebsiella quasipneumoniae]
MLSTAKSYLALFRDPVVARNVSESHFKIKDLMNMTMSGFPVHRHSAKR